MNAAMIAAVVRHLLGAIGAVGFMSDSEVEQIAGAASVLIAVGWSLWQKYQTKRQHQPS